MDQEIEIIRKVARVMINLRSFKTNLGKSVSLHHEF